MSYVCYLIKYRGSKLPPYYVGSTSLRKIISGYRGSVTSKKYSKLFKYELRKNPELFEVKILGEYEERDKATECELWFHIRWDVVKSKYFYNEAYASVNGMFGRDVRGELNPMYGKKQSNKTKILISEKRGNEPTWNTLTVSKNTLEKIGKINKGKFSAIDSEGKTGQFSVKDPRYINGELVGATKGKFAAKNLKDEKIEFISNVDKRYLNGELVGVTKGYKHTQEAKNKISESNKGRIISEETRNKISKANKGQIVTKETRDKISKANKGKTREFTDEWRKNISEGNKGKKMSQLSIQKMINSKKGKKYKQSICPYCNKSGGGGNMKRYHFDNCKLNR